jgi:hypothetical protein
MEDFRRNKTWLRAAREWATAHVQYTLAKAKRDEAKEVFLAAFERRGAVPEIGDSAEGFGGGVKVKVVHYNGHWKYDIERLMTRYPNIPWARYKTRTKDYIQVKPEILEAVPQVAAAAETAEERLTA